MASIRMTTVPAKEQPKIYNISESHGVCSFQRIQKRRVPFIESKSGFLIYRILFNKRFFFGLETAGAPFTEDLILITFNLRGHEVPDVVAVLCYCMGEYGRSTSV